MIKPDSFQESLPPHCVLVAGVDGSGKSTFLDQLSSIGYTTIEPTSTPEARNFKATHCDTVIDTALVDEREQLFLGLNKNYDREVSDLVQRGEIVATTGNSVVTALSHSVMRELVDQDGYSGNPTKHAVRRWDATDSFKPNAIVLIKAPDEVIRKRIKVRQDSGDHSERFWGFNSLFFLQRYQAEWQKLLVVLGQTSSMLCVEFDSSVMNPAEMTDAFKNTMEAKFLT